MPDLLSPVLAITCGSRIKRGRSGGGAAGVAWWASIAMFMGSIPWLVLFQRSRLGSTRSFCVACSAESPACCCASGWHSETWATMHLDGLVWTALRGGFPDLVRWTRAFQRNAGCSKTVSLHETASFLRGAALCARQYWRLFLAFMQLHNFRPPKGGGVAGSRARAPGAGRKMLRPWRMRSRCEAFWRCVIRCAKSS